MEYYSTSGEVVLLASGINIAQAIREDSLYALVGRQDKERSKICFFISHKDEDTDAAIALGKHITEDFGFNIYLDVYDNELQEADKNNDPEGVVNAIHKGIQYASHLLCIVTEKSKDSWWIPYEIGFAQAKGVKTSSIKIKQAEYIPTYLRVDNSPVFLTIMELDEYLSKNGPYGGLFSKKVAGASNEETYLYFEK